MVPIIQEQLWKEVGLNVSTQISLYSCLSQKDYNYPQDRLKWSYKSAKETWTSYPLGEVVTNGLVGSYKQGNLVNKVKVMPRCEKNVEKWLDS